MPGSLLQRQLAICLLVAIALTACDGGDDRAHAERRHLERADVYLGSEQNRAALIELRGALRYAEDNPATHLRIGYLLVRLGEPREARLAFERAARFGADADRVAVAIADTWLEERKPTEALEALGKLPAGSPVARLLSAVRAYILLGELAQAEHLLARIPDPENHPRHALRRAELAQQRGDSAAALRLAARALAGDAGLIDAWLLQGSLQFAAGQPQQAMDSYYRVAELSGEDSFSQRKIAAVRGIAQAKVELGMVEGAYRTYRELLGDTRGGLFADYQLGLDRYRAHDVDGALATLENLHLQAPRHSPTLFLLGMLSYERGALHESVEYLEKLNAVDPDNALATKLLAVVRLELGRPRAAATALRGALQLDAGDVELHLLLADALLRSGERSAALDSLATAAVSVDGDWAGEARVARLYLRAGEPQRAVELLRHTLSRGERQEPVLALMAAALADAGDDEQAQRHLAEWSERGGATPAQRFAEAAQVHRSGDAERARAALAALLEEHPGQRAARRYLAELLLDGDQREAAAEHLVELLREPVDAAEGGALATRLADLLHAGEGAERQLGEVLQKLQDSLPALRALAAASTARGDWASLEVIALQWRSARPGDAQALDYLATALLGSGRGESASELYAAYPPGDALYVHARASLARLALGDGRLSDALAYAEAALEIERNKLSALQVLARGYLRDGAFERAQEQIERIRQAPGGGALAYSLEGELWLARGDALAAAQAFRRAWELQEDRDSLVRYAAALLRADRANSALAPLQRWLDVAPGDLPVRRLAAAAAMADGADELALGHYRVLLDRAPDDPVALNNVAWLYHERDDGRALDYARRAYKLAADNPDIADTYGWLLAESGRRAEAEAVLSEAVAAHPESQALRRRLSQVRQR